ncbi:AI-2E family transporter [Agrobacterium sp. SHOUNA12C]|uniref:Permease protein n=2 Tax=Rhizobium rhizogenes TaxID=359 RepID=B9JFF7_RHIR8|nr:MULTISPECIES: AI-2E family transporter [Rhizobium]ACM26647.1 permease protein [Rhizobium rhizogenes K84]KAA6489653.1 AI-2E family transporter [Agrobacterium sp. ICMP 7243]MCJ9721549.1 AI-2E family transporter [Agrobacterium sp. BETTINA12B]MCJ9756329.1 AI-2E family transporter [Agrobacterium sp. SHOUNA12C]OCJ06062.1 AI-2E family transporter [Agrobacterium sp. 13-626]OCJ25731.1 AI-2E family transporter [Agrobacterium sp. B131/95]OCJ31170.1 AI-2E family transporter [Agrobacterium sp. B133/95
MGVFERQKQREPRWLGPTAPSRMALIPSISAARWLLILIAAAGIYFFYGFLIPVLAAAVIGFATWPLYSDLLRRTGGNTTLAAAIAIAFIVTFLVLPIVLSAIYMAGEVREWFGWAVHVNRDGAPPPQWILALPMVGAWLGDQWTQYIGSPGSIGELAQLISGAHIGNIYRAVLAAGGGAFHVILTLLFMLIALFFIYRDGSMFVRQVDLLGERILPNRWERISRVVPATISSTVMGMTLIAIGEGIVLGVAYWIAGAPSAITLGVLTGVMALVPGGAPLSMSLVSIYLIASGSLWAGIALFVWGTVELFIVDKTLRPKLVGGPIKLPFLPTFFGLVGGVKTMGFLGLFIGPVLMAIIVAIWREWIREAELTEEQHAQEPELQLKIRDGSEV